MYLDVYGGTSYDETQDFWKRFSIEKKETEFYLYRDSVLLLRLQTITERYYISVETKIAQVWNKMHKLAS
jgi:hypothetical protein